MIFENFKKRIKNNNFAIAALVILFLLVISCILAFLSPYKPNEIHVSSKLLKPSLKHFFGTDDMGRDYFTRALYGGRVSLTVGFLSMLISTFLGTVIGTVSGYFGGKVDSAIMRSIDILMCVPSFFLILIVNVYLKPGIKNIIIIIGLFSWMGIARIVRSETLSVKRREYVLSAEAQGIKKRKIGRAHV